MKTIQQAAQPTSSRGDRLPTVAVVGLALLLGNVNAIVDLVLHPEIPYFDREHLIVGGVTALAALMLFQLLLQYMRRLRTAVETIRHLEAILPICANCKKIRESGADPEARESWRPLDEYVAAHSPVLFSHGICPECMAVLYPEQEAVRRGEARHDPPSQPAGASHPGDKA